VLSRSVQAFIDCPNVHEIICVCDEERFAKLNFQAKGKNLKRVDGGAERHFSVHNGLQALDPTSEIVAVHDGARPLISPSQISTCIDLARKHKASASARPVTETLKRADSSGKAIESINREQAWLMETPQCFERTLLEEAYKKVLSDKLLVTDEVSAVEHLGINTFLVNNSQPNPKITFAQDLPLAEHLISFQS